MSSASSAGVVVVPGVIATAVMPNRAHSTDSVRARFSSAARAAGACGPASGAGATNSRRPGIWLSIIAPAASARPARQACSRAARSASGPPAANVSAASMSRACTGARSRAQPAAPSSSASTAPAERLHVRAQCLKALARRSRGLAVTGDRHAAIIEQPGPEGHATAWGRAARREPRWPRRSSSSCSARMRSRIASAASCCCSRVGEAMTSNRIGVP